MKEFKNFIITILLTALMTLIILKIASNIFIPKWITHEGNMMSYIIKGFYKEPKNTLDVIFMGNSDVYRGISPMTLYEESGITSYNFVSSGQRMWMAYPIFLEALKRQTPKIIFFNVDSFFYTHKASDGNYHKVFDNMPLGIPKIKGALDANYPGRKLKKLTHFLPILFYHNRYNELTKNDFKYAFYDYTNPTKGMDLIGTIKPYNKGNYYMTHNSSSAVKIPEKNQAYLNEMIDICKEKGITMILMELPSAESWSLEKNKVINAYAKEHNVDFIDMNLDPILKEMNFDWTHDTSDGGDHLNIYGAEKTTMYLANYLKTNFDLKSHKDDPKYAIWNEQYQTYLKIREKEINEA